MGSTGQRGGRYQVNVPLNDAHWHLALMQLSMRDEMSVPDLLRPVIISFLSRHLESDPDLEAAVAALERAKTRDQVRGEM
jgi:hypothetical protein